MKTLKKTLCLVLAVVMVLGLGVMSASAKLDNYSDKDAITYKEAVDVMTGIGVLQGDAGGFRPTDSVKRSEAAKIIAYLLIGNAAQADALKTNSDPFTDVPATHWAAGYIAYCAQRGIISGMGDGTFAPDAQVTGLQFAKMLLSAIGYNANDEYSGSEWAINVSKDALTLKLFNGNLAGATNTAATREECALYAFNTLDKSKVTYSALLGGYIEANTGMGLNGATNETESIQKDFKLVKVESEADAFQRPAGHHWYVDKTTNIISATYGNPNDAFGDVEDLKASYTTEVKASDIYNLLGKTFIDGANGKQNDVEGKFEVYVDGDLVADEDTLATTDTEIVLDNFTKGNTKTLDHTGNGVQTNVYAWTSKSTNSNNKDITINHITITVVNTYLAKVEDVKAGTSTKDPVTKVTVLQTIDEDSLGQTPAAATLKDLDLTDTMLDAKGFNTDEFDEGDYVFITAAKDGSKYVIQSMVAPTIKESTVTRYNKSGSTITFTADGDSHTAAKNTAQDADIYAANNTDDISRDIVDGEKHTLYIDEYGYLVSVADIDVDSDYVYVAQFGSKSDTSDDLKDKDNLVADIYYADGTHKIVTVNTDKTKDGDSITIPNDLDNCFAGENAANYSTLSSTKLGVYELTMVKGKAVLTNPGVAASNSNINVTKGNSRIDGDKADGKTVFFYVHETYDDDDFSVTAYTGINSIPVSKADGVKPGNTPEAAAVAAIVDDGTIKAMQVNSNFEGEKGDTVYFYTGISYGVQAVGDGTYEVTYVVYVDGAQQELTLNYKDRDTARDQYNDADNFEYEFFTVKNNDKHTFDSVNDDDDKFDGDKFHVDLVVNQGDMDKATIISGDQYSYSAQSMTFVDLRDVDEDDLYTSVTSLQKDIDEGDFTGAKVSVRYADNASRQISVMYLVAGTYNG